MQGQLIIRCPEMPVLATWNPLVRECQELVCPNCEINLEDGRQFTFTITFPKAKVRLQSFGKWLVDEVPAAGRLHNGSGSPIQVTMEKEWVLRTSWCTMDAQPCLAYGTVELDGKVCQIVPKTHPDGSQTFFPKCTTTAAGLGLFKYIAEPVVAEAVVVIPE